MPTVRRSARLALLSTTITNSLKSNSRSPEKTFAAKAERKIFLETAVEPPKKSTKRKHRSTNDRSVLDSLPRTREVELVNQHVFGVDECGRGPLAGPVVAAAAFLPAEIPGIIDSKCVSKEAERERIFEQIAQSPGTRWTAAIVDAATIDEINILQASLLAMKMASDALLLLLTTPAIQEDEQTMAFLSSKASSNRTGCYVIGGYCDIDTTEGVKQQIKTTNVDTSFYALVDGQHLPKNMPCLAESIIKGDSKEYCIAAASIIAKVTRDRLMRQYAEDELLHIYNFAQHKGYPTKPHKEAIMKNGPSFIHRRTFQPVKGMLLNKKNSSSQSPY